MAAVTGVGGITDGGVAIVDLNSANTDSTKANTITSVTLDGYGSSLVATNALANLTLANSKLDVTVIDNSATATATALNLTVNNLGGAAALTDAKIKTLTVTASGKASALSLTGAALTTETIAGDQKFTQTGATAAVTSVVSTNTGGVTMTLNAGSAGTFGDGADTITVGAAATKAVTLGNGNDTANVSTLGTGGTVDGGAGTDTLSMAAAAAATASLTNTFAGVVTGFEKLSLGVGAGDVIDLAVLGAYNDVTAAGGSLTLNNMASGGNLTLTAAGVAYAVNITNALAGTADVLNLNLKSATSATFGTVTAANVETINIQTTDSSTTPNGTVTDTVTIAGNDVKAITPDWHGSHRADRSFDSGHVL